MKKLEYKMFNFGLYITFTDEIFGTLIVKNLISNYTVNIIGCIIGCIYE